MAEQTSEEKDLPASEKKLEEAREKGQVPKSAELVTAAVTVSGIFYVISITPTVAQQFAALVIEAGHVVTLPFDKEVQHFAFDVVLTGVFVLMPLLGLIIFAAVLANVVAMGGMVFAIDPIMPSLEKINPIQGFKNLFRVNTLIEALKSILKLVVVSVVSIFLMSEALQPLVSLPYCGIPCTPDVLRGTLIPLLIMAALFFVVIGLIDIVIQRWLFARQMKMTKTEMKEESKNTEGNPVVKREQKRVRKEAAMSRAGLKQTTFSITGSGITVGMRFNFTDAKVPILVAKSVGDHAGEMAREIQRLGMPDYYDAGIAAQILEKTKLGQPIPVSIYQPVINAMRQMGLL